MRQLGPVLDFLRALWALDHALQSASKRMETKLGVTGPQRFVIRMIGRFPGISAGEVSELLHVHPSTLTGVLKRLEHRGLVLRRADPADARRALLELTAKGRRVDAVRIGTVEGAARKVLTRVKPGAIRETRALAEAITAELDRLGE
jgi:MarR family transcriptional regulator, organic hydroperoxide resistance regulator